jgi:hypothetical protein
MTLYCPNRCINNGNKEGECKKAVIILDPETIPTDRLWANANRMSCRHYEPRPDVPLPKVKEKYQAPPAPEGDHF